MNERDQELTREIVTRLAMELMGATGYLTDPEVRALADALQTAAESLRRLVPPEPRGEA